MFYAPSQNLQANSTLPRGEGNSTECFASSTPQGEGDDTEGFLTTPKKQEGDGTEGFTIFLSFS